MDPFLQREVDAVARQVKLEYAGKDPNTKEKASCANWVSCDNFLLDLQRKDRGEANIERKMLKCSSCKVLRYCSRSCQVAHFSEHKAGCREIREARKKVGALETAMRGGPIAAWDENAYTDW